MNNLEGYELVYKGKVNEEFTTNVSFFGKEGNMAGKILEVYNDRQNNTLALVLDGELLVRGEPIRNGEIVNTNKNSELSMLMEQTTIISQPVGESSGELVWE